MTTKIIVDCAIDTCMRTHEEGTGMVYFEPRITIDIEDPCGWGDQDEETRDHVDRDMVGTTCVFRGIGYEDKEVAKKELRAAAFAVLRPEVYAGVALALDHPDACSTIVHVSVEGTPYHIATGG